VADRRFGKYELTAALGQGGMGAVYQARDTVLDRPVALKVVSPKLLSERDALVRFQREARAAAKLQHPNIVTIFDLGEEQGTLYIAMELLDGMDLYQAMRPLDRLSVEEKVRIVAEVCRGLDYAHKRGVVHRDIKPANIRILSDGSVKVLDFGIAHMAGSQLTQTGIVLGTPSYMAPEVIASGRIDHRADVWSLGVVLYEVLTGVRPYDSPEFARVLYRIVHEPLPAIDPRLEVPETLLRVLTRALTRDPAQRYQELAEMGRDLQAVFGHRWKSDTPIPAETRQRAFEHLWHEAEALCANGDLERALEAARQAQALDPSRPEIVALVDRLQDALLTLPPGAVRSAAPSAPTRAAAPAAAPAPPPARSVPDAPTVHGGEASGVLEPAPAVRRPTTPMAASLAAELRQRGASAFRELATFGEPPATQLGLLCPTRPLLATSGSDGAIRIWDLGSQRRVQILRSELHQRTGHDALALALAFSPDGQLLASGHVDGAVHLWHLESGEEYPVRLRHENIVGALAFAPDGQTLASGGMDSNLKLWNVEAAVAGDARRELHRQPSGVTSIAYAGGGSWVVTGHGNRVLRVSDAKTGRLVATLRGPEGQVHLLCLAPDGKRLAVASQDRTVRFFDLETRAQMFVLPAQRKPTSSLSFFGDGCHFATVAQDNAVQLWDLEKRSSLAALWGPTDESFASVALFGDHIAVALADGRIRLWGPAY
jgi:eukaryotic-like serine/threonine-protein kinase